MFKIFYEDMNEGDTETFGKRSVSREEVIEFAEKYDPQPFHLNDEAAKMTPFGKLCASGWHTCAMTMRMMVDQLMARGVAAMGSPGVDELRWLKPVFPGDTLSVTNHVISKRASDSKPHIGLIAFTTEVSNQSGDVVMRFGSTMMIMRRGG